MTINQFSTLDTLFFVVINKYLLHVGFLSGQQIKHHQKTFDGYFDLIKFNFISSRSFRSFIFFVNLRLQNKRRIFYPHGAFKYKTFFLFLSRVFANLIEKQRMKRCNERLINDKRAAGFLRIEYSGVNYRTTLFDFSFTLILSSVANSMIVCKYFYNYYLVKSPR